MAAPVTHVILTQKVFSKHFKDKKREEFFTGTLFPDIRYLGAIKRSKTHSFNLSLEEAKKGNSFEAGLKFHSLLDETRSSFLKKQPERLYRAFIKSAAVKSKFNRKDWVLAHQNLKLLEDEIHYEKIKNWGIYVDYLNNILKQELSFNIPRQIVRKWHRLLQEYFSQKPNDNSRKKMLLGFNFSKKAIQKENLVIKKLKRNSYLQRKIAEFYNKFEEFLL